MITIPMTMAEVLFIVGISFLSGGVLASLYWHHKLAVLRISWIRLEHNLARATKREPREIDEVIS